MRKVRKHQRISSAFSMQAHSGQWNQEAQGHLSALLIETSVCFARCTRGFEALSLCLQTLLCCSREDKDQGQKQHEGHTLTSGEALDDLHDSFSVSSGHTLGTHHARHVKPERAVRPPADGPSSALIAVCVCRSSFQASIIISSVKISILKSA